MDKRDRTDIEAEEKRLKSSTAIYDAAMGLIRSAPVAP